MRSRSPWDSIPKGVHASHVLYLGISTLHPSTSLCKQICMKDKNVPSWRIFHPAENHTSGYDAAGNLTAYIDSVTGSWSSIGYDTLNRLSAATQAPVTGSAQYYCWSYDSFGNRTGETSVNQPFTNAVGSSQCAWSSSATLLSNDWNTYTVNGTRASPATSWREVSNPCLLTSDPVSDSASKPSTGAAC